MSLADEYREERDRCLDLATKMRVERDRLRTDNAQLRAALAELLVTAKRDHEARFAFSCDHDAEDCTCDEEARSHVAIEKAERVLGLIERTEPEGGDRG